MGASLESYRTLGLVMGAFVVGLLLPLLFQLFATLRSLQRLAEQNEAGLREAVRQLGQAAAHWNRIGARLDSRRTEEGLESLVSFGTMLAPLRGWTRLLVAAAAALGPALMAGIRALQQARAQTRGETDAAPPHEGDAGTALPLTDQPAPSTEAAEPSADGPEPSGGQNGHRRLEPEELPCHTTPG